MFADIVIYFYTLLNIINFYVDNIRPSQNIMLPAAFASVAFYLGLYQLDVVDGDDQQTYFTVNFINH